MKLLVGYGTKPEYIKLVPLLKQLKDKIETKVVFTGQQPDLAPQDIADVCLGAPKKLENRLDELMVHILSSTNLYDDITHVLVQGDTTSGLALAQGAFHRQIPIIHLEAGLRTFKKTPFPEEFNRTAISLMAETHLCATELNKRNLLAEGGPYENIHVVGNTVLDNIKDTSILYNNNIIITLHRRENWHCIKDYFIQIDSLAWVNKNLNFIIPMHPNPDIQKLKSVFTAPNIEIKSAMPYDKFIKELAKCKFIITDSGGIQEEAAFLCKKLVICREFTERPEVLIDFGHLCAEPKMLKGLFNMINDYPIPTGKCPFGDGHASEKILKILEKL